MTIATKEEIDVTITLRIDEAEYDVTFAFIYYQYLDDSTEIISERQLDKFPLANAAAYLTQKDYSYVEERIRENILFN